MEAVSDEADGACVAVLIESSEELLDEPLPDTAAVAVDVLLWPASPTARAPVPSAAAAAIEAVTARTRRRPRRRSSNGSGDVEEEVMSASVAPGCRSGPWRRCGPAVGVVLTPTGEKQRSRDDLGTRLVDVVSEGFATS